MMKNLSEGGACYRRLGPTADTGDILAATVAKEAI